MRRSTWLKRLLRAAALATIGAWFVAVPVSAKMPYFSVEITPAVPVAGEPILIEVRFWVDAGHTDPAPFDVQPAMDGLLVIRAAEAGEPDIPVALRMRAPGRFHGSVTLQPGDWKIVAFPDRTGWATAAVPVGYPDSIPFTVRRPVSEGPGLVVPLVAVALVVAAGAMLLRPALPGRQGASLDTEVTQ